MLFYTNMASDQSSAEKTKKPSQKAGLSSNPLLAQVVQYIEPSKQPLLSSDLVRVPFDGPWGTVPELLFEKKSLIPVLQQLLIEGR
ncbi:hypothetical protein ACFLV5_01620 [Chloroflexota bacterium]